MRQLALDVRVGAPAQPGGEVPVPAAEEPHARWHEDAADERRVDQQRDPYAEPDLLNLGDLASREADEDGDDDECRPRDHPRRGRERVAHGLLVVPGLQVTLADPGEEE